jgi:signal transduction histidine kinase/ActR/RegA family two-component response regulator
VSVGSSTSAVARLRAASLSVKLAALGATVTAAVVWAAFWGLSVETRANTTQVFTRQLERNQRTLRLLQERNARQLLFTASLVSQAPNFQYSLKQFQAEANRGATPAPQYAREIDGHAQRLVQNARADLLVITDDSGRVFSVAGERASLRRGDRLSSLPAVAAALDPAAPADTGDLAVLETSAGYFQVGVYPLVQDGITLGALLLGQRLDSAFVVAASDAAGDAVVVLTAGTRVVSASDGRLATADVSTQLAATGGNARATTMKIGAEEYVVAPVKLGDTQRRDAVRLWMLQPLSRRVTALMEPLRVDFIVYGALAVLVAAIGSAVVARRVLAPFTRFVDHMRSGAAADQRQGGFDADREAVEVRTLNESFNQLMDSIAVKRRALEERTAELASANVVLTDEINERIRVEQALRESEAQLRQSQKLEAIGTLAGGIAHDFNNLITVISGYTQLVLMRAEKGSAAAEDLKQVVEASDRAANLTHQLLAFSRKQVLQPTVLDLGEVVNGIAPMLRRIIGEHIVLTIAAEPSLARVYADRGQIEQVLLNLAVNARDAMTSGGALTIATSNVRAEPRGVATGVSLVVRDTGSGMSADVKDRIFEPFFTTKDVGKGTGLGLSMVYGIVKQSGGTIAVDSAPGRGTVFTIALPVAEQIVASDITRPHEVELPKGNETILIVEDAEDVRILARRTLEELGYAVRVARSAAEALEIAGGGSVDVLLTDIVMPVTSGPELVAEYLTTRPASLVIYMSGYADDALERYKLDAGAVFLRKPFTPAVLARTVRSAIDTRRASAGVGSAAD